MRPDSIMWGCWSWLHCALLYFNNHLLLLYSVLLHYISRSTKKVRNQNAPDHPPFYNSNHLLNK